MGGQAAGHGDRLPPRYRLRRLHAHQADLSQGGRRAVLPHGAELSKGRGRRSEDRARRGGGVRRILQGSRGAGLHAHRPGAHPLALHHQLGQLRNRQKAPHGGRTASGTAAAQRYGLRAVPSAGVRTAAGGEKHSGAQAQAVDHRRVPRRGEGPELEVPAHGGHRRVHGVRENAGGVRRPDAERGLRRQVDCHEEIHYLHDAGRQPLPRQ